MLETNYDAGLALTIWRQVSDLAAKRGEVRLATRAKGEQGIAAFILGDTNTAKNQVLEAWGLSYAERDPLPPCAMPPSSELGWCKFTATKKL